MILAIDVGTSSVKAAVVDRGQIEGLIARAPFLLSVPEPGAAELSLASLMDLIGRVAREALAGRRVSGIGLSTLTPALVLLDSDDRPLGPAWTHADRRATRFAEKLWQERGGAFLAEVGSPPLPGGISGLSYLCRLEREPELLKRVKSFLHLNGWLAFELTGEKRFDPANASFTGFYSTLSRGEWSPFWCDYFRVSEKWLPPVVPGEETVGGLRTAMAEWLDLPAGIPVKLGTADTTSAWVGAGAEYGDLLHVVGTTQVLATLVKTPLPAPRRLVRALGVGEGYLHVTHNPVGGVALEWVRALCFSEMPGETFYERVLPEVGLRSTSVELDPPYLGGDRLQRDAVWASLHRLTLQTKREDVLAAVLIAMREGHHDALADLGSEIPVKRHFLTGGGADSVARILPGGGQAERLIEGSLLGASRLFEI